jgi:hypothetical protein
LRPECVDTLLLDLWLRHVKSKVLLPGLQIFFLLSRFFLSRPSACGELRFDLLLLYPVYAGAASEAPGEQRHVLRLGADRGLADRRWGSLVITLRRSAGAPPGVGDEEVLGGAMSSILEVFYDDGAVDGRGVVVGCLPWSVGGGFGDHRQVGAGLVRTRAWASVVA